MEQKEGGSDSARSVGGDGGKASVRSAGSADGPLVEEPSTIILVKGLSGGDGGGKGSPRDLRELRASWGDEEAAGETSSLLPVVFTQSVVSVPAAQEPSVADVTAAESPLEDFREAGRESIFSKESAGPVSERVAAATGAPAKSEPLHSFFGVVVQIVVLLASVVASAMYPLAMDYALRDPVTGVKKMRFDPCEVYFLYYGLSAVLGVIFSWEFLGVAGLKRCFTDRATFARVVPAGVLLTVAEIVDIVIMQYAEPSEKSIVSQIRLPAVALLSMVVLKKKISLEQATLLAIVAVSTTGFSLANAAANAAAAAAAAGPGASVLGAGFQSLLGPALVAAQAMLVAVVFIVSEFTLKKVDCPFTVQMAQTRFVGAVVAAGAWAAIRATAFFAAGSAAGSAAGPAAAAAAPFAGMGRRVAVLLFALVARDWFQTFLLKVLSSLWKALSGGLAVCLTFATQVVYLGAPVHLVPLGFLFNTVFGVLGYAFASRRASLPVPGRR